jgi:hypothetical protein
MQTQPAYRRRHGFAMHRLIDPVPVIGRQAGDFREPVDIERFIEVIVNMLKHSV